MKKMKGFSLIELLIVIVIIGILASISLPSYKHYTERARFAEVIMSTLPYKTAVAVALQEGDPIDTLNTGVNGIPDAPKSTENLQRLTVNQGIITATATQKAGGYTYILKPDENGSIWEISGTCVEENLCK